MLGCLHHVPTSGTRRSSISRRVRTGAARSTSSARGTVTRRCPSAGGISRSLPPNLWHRHHLSGGSSQLLAIALLAAATRADPSLRWLFGDTGLTRPLTLFEVELAPAVLNEWPRQTAIDWLVVDRENVIAAEAKFTERGLGQCSCQHRKAGECSIRVLARPYWSVASRDMALTRTDQACSLSLAYQAVRNVAAARALPEGEGRPSLALRRAQSVFRWCPRLAGMGQHASVDERLEHRIRVTVVARIARERGCRRGCASVGSREAWPLTVV